MGSGDGGWWYNCYVMDDNRVFKRGGTMSTVFYPVTVTGSNGELKNIIKEPELKKRHWDVFWDEFKGRQNNNYVYAGYIPPGDRLPKEGYLADYKPRYNHNKEAP